MARQLEDDMLQAPEVPKSRRGPAQWNTQAQCAQKVVEDNGSEESRDMLEQNCELYLQREASKNCT